MDLRPVISRRIVEHSSFVSLNRALKFTLEKKLGGGSAGSSVAILKRKWMLLHLKTLLF